MNYLKYYHLEDYLFEEVKNNFHKRGYLKPEEFFCIIIWKANRAKTRIRDKVLKKDKNLVIAIKRLTSEIFKALENKNKLKVLLEDWKFSLPMATAILTVLYPNNFTVYDVRVRGQLNIEDFSGRRDEIKRYFSEFLPKVKKCQGKNLRDKDRILWGKSFYKDLKQLIK